MYEQPGQSGHVSLTDTYVLGYGQLHVPTLDEVGGETALFNNPTEFDTYTSAVIACANWPELTDQAAATVAIGRAVTGFQIEELMSFCDIALAAPQTLPYLATTLAAAWRTISEDDATTRGNVALEAWTRLAIGGWTNSLQLRGALDARCENASRATATADIFLVRAVGAALDQWADDDLHAALRRLADFEDIECDVAFELGMTQLRAAVESKEPADAAVHLDAAAQMFDHSSIEGERPDAVAFRLACAAVAAFLLAQPVPEGSATAIENAVGHWYLGYLNEVPHWRQARAQTGAAWAALVADLQKVSALDDYTWLEPITLLADIGRIYLSHNSSMLLANPRQEPGELQLPTRTRAAAQLDREETRAGVPVAIGPRLDSALAASAERADLIDRWLTSVPDHLPDLPTEVIDAVATARIRIREAPRAGKRDASRDAAISDGIREALADNLDGDTLARVVELLEPVLGMRTVLDAPHVSLASAQESLREHLVLRELHEGLRMLLPAEHAAWFSSLNVVLTALCRVAAITIDHTQGGERRLPWHGDIAEGSQPAEHRLADYIAQSIQILTGIRTHVEVPNIGGGRADVVIPVAGEEFVIEVKRQTAQRTDAQLTAAYADQAAQYTHTRTPFAFLAVLDLTRHQARLGLDASFWISEWTDGSVTRALIGLRILADVAPPSDLS